MGTTEVTEALDRSAIHYELLSHRRTERAAEEAAALELAPDEVAKTIVVVGERGRARLVLPASQRVDLRKARTALEEGNDVRLATEDELATAYPMFELGAVPPVGGPAGDRVLVDPRIAERESIVFEAGSHGESVRVNAAEVLALSHAEIADVCREEP